MTLTGLDAAAALLALGYFANRRNEAPVAYQNGHPVQVTLEAVDEVGHLLAAPAAAAFRSMRAAAEAAGINLVVESAFRTMEEQTSLWVEFKRGTRTDVVAPPGYSVHQSGRAVDLSTGRGTNTAYRWLLENAHLYDFKATVPSEPWHWEHTV